MFHKTIETLKATEAAIEEELKALWVPYDPETGNGGLHWHAAAAGILQNAQRGVAGLREELEKRQGPIDEADAAAKQAEEDAAKADAEQKAREEAAATEAPVVSGASTDDPAPDPQPTLEPEPEPPTEPGV